MKKLLITGFEPFGEHHLNPSWDAVDLLPNVIGDHALTKLRIPTVYGEAARTVLDAAAAIGADAILCVGLAAGREAITPERIAVNIRDARLPDNAGRLCSGEKVDPDGPAAYFSPLPLEQMVKAIRDQQIPAAISNTAGTYVCNDVLYTLLRHYEGTHVRCGFIHVPQLPAHEEPNLPLEQITAALAAAIAAI